MEAVKRIMRYLKTTPGKGLEFRKIDGKTIEAYFDSDETRSIVDRRLPPVIVPLFRVIL